MTESTSNLNLPLTLTKPVVLDFGGGDLTSDAGLLVLAQADAQAGVSTALTSVLRERRQTAKVRHPLAELVQARVLAIAAGYPDANDLDHLRCDPALKVACGQCPQSGRVLVSQPTVSRWENGLRRRELLGMGRQLAQRVIGQLPATTQRVILDIDASEDPCHGQQEFEGFNRYYDSHCYLPLFLHLTDESGMQWPLAALLRPGRTSPLQGVAGVLRRAVGLLRARFPPLEIVVRGDCGFGSDAVLRCCDQLGVDYVLGLSSNARLTVLGTPIQMDCALAYQWRGEGCREYGEFGYKAGSWDRARRTIIKVEMIQRQLNARYVVTSLAADDGLKVRNWVREPAAPQVTAPLVTAPLVTAPLVTAEVVYSLYCGRGEQENRLKELKLDLASGRTSCHRFLANQGRLLLALAAHVLWSVVRVAAHGTRWARAQVGTLRLQLQKVAARVVESVRRVCFHFCSAYPYQTDWRRLQAQLGVCPGGT